MLVNLIIRYYRNLLFSKEEEGGEGGEKKQNCAPEVCLWARTVHHQEEINSPVYQGILLDNVKVAVCQLKLSRGWVVQQYNYSKNSSMSIKE